MPLIDNSYDILVTLDIVNFIENPFISLVNQDSFLFGADFAKNRNKKIDSASIYRFSKCLSSSHMKSIEEIIEFASPAACSFVCLSYSFPDQCVGVKVRLNLQCF